MELGSLRLSWITRVCPAGDAEESWRNSRAMEATARARHVRCIESDVSDLDGRGRTVVDYIGLSMKSSSII